jgi:DNA-binding transcriptional MerR regulator
MAEFPFSEQEFEIDDNDPLFVISVVSELVHIPIWTLRKLDDHGIVKAQRKGKKTRCYTKNQIKKLTYIYYLMENKGVNIKGIKFILELDEGGDGKGQG